MNRTIWYPILAATALYCAEPVASQGIGGLAECFHRFTAACAAILAT